jgi:hypothetical protein
MAHRTVRWCTRQDTVHCPVRATSAHRWGLEQLTVEVLCPLAAPDNPVAHRTCPMRSDFAAPTFDLHTIHFYCTPQSTVGAVHRCFTGSLDMSGTQWTVRWIITEWLFEKHENDQLGRCSAWAPDSVRCAIDNTISSLCSKLCWFPNLTSFLVYVELYAPQINDD